MDQESHDERGRFKKGNPGGPGRPHRIKEAALATEIRTRLEVGNRWGKIIEAAIEAAIGNDSTARQWLSEYTIGKPQTRISIGRDDAEDWSEFDGLSINEIRAIASGPSREPGREGAPLPRVEGEALPGAGEPH